MNISNAEKARRIIEQNVYMALATSDNSGSPWVATLYYAYDSQYNFYFLSAKDSLHATHIEINPRVAMAIYDSCAPPGEGDGVQIEGRAYLAKPRELPHIIAVYFRRRFPDEVVRAMHKHFPWEYQGKHLLRFFKVVPVKVYTLDLTETKVDRRVEVDLFEK